MNDKFGNSFLSFSKPEFLEKAKSIMEILKKLNTEQIQKLMNISPTLSIKTYEYYQRWDFDHSIKNSLPAIFAYTGDVYKGLQSNRFSSKDLTYANQHLRIISGLYGILKANDFIQAYRLDIKTICKYQIFNGLYEYWRANVSGSIARDANSHNCPIINLLSTEYFSVINPQIYKSQIITPSFLDYSKGSYRVMSSFAKNARGQMANFIIKNQITHTIDIKDFNSEGYCYNIEMSSKNDIIFTRK